MHVIRARNAHTALPIAVAHLREHGVPRESRQGQVLVAPEPVTTVYTRSRERAMYHVARDANPFLHFFGAMWMLAGRDDVAFLARFAPKMKAFAEDDGRMHGAYGHRWSYWPGMLTNQLTTIANALRDDPTCRRQVLTMWDPARDLGAAKRDLPCNTHVYPTVGLDGRLDITVCCRSNDIVWGCYGADVVDFGFLHEWLGELVARPAGVYTHVSNNWHGYTATFEKIRDLDGSPDPYAAGEVRRTPLVAPGETPLQVESEMRDALRRGPAALPDLRSTFVRNVLIPMWSAHALYKNRSVDKVERVDAALAVLKSMPPWDDWRRAAEEWLERRRPLWPR